jgi:hypothetical protein
VFLMQLSLFVISALIAVSTQAVRIGQVPTIPNGIVTEPRVVHSTPPAYTIEARQLGIERYSLSSGLEVDRRFVAAVHVERHGFMPMGDDPPVINPA